MELFLEIISYIFWVILAIMILVFVHELGHYLFAKLFKMRVDRFSIGFPPKIFGKRVGETEYVIGATPLGGYVKIAGMVDESMDTDFAQSEPKPWEFRSKPVWQRLIVITAGVAFNVLLAFFIFAGLKLAYGEDYIPAENIEGVYVEENSLAYNMGLRTGDHIIAVSGKELEAYSDLEGFEALLADPMTITVKRNHDTLTFKGPEDIMTQLNRQQGYLGISPVPSLVGGVMEGSAAEESGLRPGDRIVSIAGEAVRFWNEMTTKIQESEGQPIVLQWVRPDSLVNDRITDERVEVPVPTSHPDSLDDSTVVTEGSEQPRRIARRGDGWLYESVVTPRRDDSDDRYYLGIAAPTANDPLLLNEFGVRHRDYTLGTALSAGVSETWLHSKAIVTSLKRIFTGRENLRENVGGPIMIAKVTKEAAEQGARVFWRIVALLSITLAIMNMLPIPALDGGHVMFLLYEGITRREPSLRVRMAMQQVGMILLLVFMTFLIFNDILRF